MLAHLTKMVIVKRRIPDMNKEEFLKEFNEYASTLDDTFRDEWYSTEKRVWEHFFWKFIEWKFGEENESGN